MFNVQYSMLNEQCETLKEAIKASIRLPNIYCKLTIVQKKHFYNAHFYNYSIFNKTLNHEKIPSTFPFTTEGFYTGY